VHPEEASRGRASDDVRDSLLFLLLFRHDLAGDSAVRSAKSGPSDERAHAFSLFLSLLGPRMHTFEAPEAVLESGDDGESGCRLCGTESSYHPDTIHRCFARTNVQLHRLAVINDALALSEWTDACAKIPREICRTSNI